MNAWALAAAVLVAATVPALLLIARGTVMDAVVALEMVGVMAVSVMLLLAQADGDAALADPAVVLAFLSFGAGLVFVRFFERWV